MEISSAEVRLYLFDLVAHLTTFYSLLGRSTSHVADEL
jgi:hypothetical protein